jgi:hypothetical protein
MRPLLLALALAAAAPASASPRVRAEARAGVAYDSNVNHAPAEGDAAADVAATGALGIALEAGVGDLSFFVDGSAARTQYLTYEDLSLSRFAAQPGVLLFLGDATILRAGVQLAWRDFTEDARDGVEWGASAAVRQRLTGFLALRAGYRYRDRDAEDEVYRTTSHIGSIELELGLGRRTTLAASYDLEIGEEVFYAEPLVAAVRVQGRGPGGDGPRRSTTAFDEPLEAYREPVTAHGLGALLVHRAGFLRLSLAYDFTIVDGELETYRAHGVSVGAAASF